MSLLGILSFLAYPSYHQVLLKAHRLDALAALERAQILLENCYRENLSYAAPCKTLPKFPQDSDEGYYSLALSELTPTNYRLTASVQGSQTRDHDCFSFSINAVNQRMARDKQGNIRLDCWGK